MQTNSKRDFLKIEKPRIQRSSASRKPCHTMVG